MGNSRMTWQRAKVLAWLSKNPGASAAEIDRASQRPVTLSCGVELRLALTITFLGFLTLGIALAQLAGCI